MRAYPRSPRATTLRVIAALCAATAVWSIFSSAMSLRRQAHALGEQIPVVLARRSLHLGESVRANDLIVVTRHASQVPRLALHALAAAVGRTVVVPILADTPLQVGNVTSATSSAIPTGVMFEIPSGRRALRVSDHEGLRPKAGSVVDLLANYGGDPTATPPESIAANNSVTTRLIARGAIVIDDALTEFSPRNTNRLQGESAAPGIIVLVSDNEVEAVSAAAAFGVVTVVLVPTEEACCPSP